MKNTPFTFTHDLICECQHAVLQSTTMMNVEKMHEFKKNKT